MRGGNAGMNEECQDTVSSYSKLANSLLVDPKKRMIFCTQSELEQQSALEAIRRLAVLMNSGGVLHVVIKRQSRNVGTIEVFVEDSKEMS